MPTELLRVEGLSKFFRLRRRLLAREERLARAVDGVSFSLDEGEILGVVGESGCGKTTLARLILRLIEPSSGRIWLDGTDITGLSQTELRRWRQRMQIVFQDHLASLDPRVTIGRSIGFPLEVHGLAAGRVLRAAVEDLLQRVGLDRLFYGRLPHQLSGGQRQRVTIARALAVDPRLIVADEPVASLDLSAQGQILNLFADLLKERGISYIFITHDLNVAAYLCDRIMVMYGGKVVELAPAGEIFARPRHPYTQALISAAMLGGLQSQIGEIVLEGDPPRPSDPPPGCKFHPRCFLTGAYCRQVEPELRSVAEQHRAACHVAHGVPVGS
jgi:peptide/nickel transport system ATP-binding protein/oligopeptide transport system ATP-binding protein